MSRLLVRRTAVTVSFAACLFGLSLGLTCPQGGGVEPSLDPVPLPGIDRPPRITVTEIATPQGDNSAQLGDVVIVEFAGQDDSPNGAQVRVFASQDANPDTSVAIELPVFRGGTIGPGSGTGEATWNTGGVVVGDYHIFAEIDDGANPPVLATFVDVVTLTPVPPEGTESSESPPQLIFLDPLANLGLAAQDEVTVRYIYADTDSDVTVTLLLDKDLDPTNDDINDPGDPQDPTTNIIILPSTVRQRTDPTFDGDPPPPDDPNNLPVQSDSVEIRTNPRTLPQTSPTLVPFPGAPMIGELKEYRFLIDFTQIPVRADPYFIRATVTDGTVTVHEYAVGSLTISSLAEGVVDLEKIGFELAGARFQGFSDGENLGSQFVAATDLDLDGVEDFMIASRYSSPRNRFQSGAAYLIYGRRKTPFPPDTNNNGLPDVPDPSGAPIDFPEPPEYLPNPYDARNVGRFGGVVSINSVTSFFRGTVYGMPEAHHDAQPPDTLADANHPSNHTAGLTSITRIDMTGDGVPDFVFGLPFVSSAWDHHDDDPVDGGCDVPYRFSPDFDPNAGRCDVTWANDDLWSARPRSGPDPQDQGLVIMVDGTNDIRNTFNTFVDANLAGQHDPDGAVDDEGVLWGGAFVPIGTRFRGGWFDPLFTLDVSGDPPGPTLGDNGADDCAAAPVITEGVTTFDTRGATDPDPAGPNHNACLKDEFDQDDGIHQDIWWQYTATCSGALTVETCAGARGFGSADFDTRLAVYNTCDCDEADGGTLLNCSDDADDCGDTSVLVVPVFQGQCYLIRVGGYTIHEGTGEINVSCTPFLSSPTYYSDAEFGRTVATLPDFDNLGGDELLVSSPGYDPAGGFDAVGDPQPFNLNDLERGMIQIWLSHNYINADWYGDEVFSFPSYTQCPRSCTPGVSACLRCFVALPSHNTILGEQVGDRFGFASAAGQFNQDGVQDVLAGAPGADRQALQGGTPTGPVLTDNGVFYVLFLPGQGLGDTDLASTPFPRLEVIGSHAGDGFGKVQTAVRDMNEDNIDDIAFSAASYDDAILGADVGYVGVIFGNRPLTGEVGFAPEQVGTSGLEGVRFIGAAAGARAGAGVASAGDFNGDGVGDLLITSPGEERTVDGQVRVGVAYLIFGGRHLLNGSFNLSEVGQAALPGIVFISRFAKGTADEAPLDTVGGLGDIDGDGFDDIVIGAPTADFVFPSSPNQRRLDAGEVYIVYGSNFGSNDLNGGG